MISVVLYGRNDNYGYNLPKRVALSLNCIAEVLMDPTDEILFVDYNTPDDFPTFPEAIRDTLTDRVRKMLRIFRVRPSIHARFKSKTKLVALEPIARNVAVRRSQPSNRWILSTNTDLIFVPQRLVFLSEVAKDLDPGIYHAPRIEIPEALWEGLDRHAPQAAIDMVREWGRTLYLDEIVYGSETILYDGPGDFQLIERSDLFQYHGFHEEMLLGWHVDSNIASRLRLVYGKIGDLGDDVRGYHCDHTRQVTPAHSHTRTENDWQRFIRDVDWPHIPEQAETWGCPDDDIEEIHIEKNFSKFYAKALQRAIGAPLERPLVASYTEKTYNKVDYDPRHVVPFLVDMFLASPKISNVAWYGARAETLRLFTHAWRNCGFTGRILVADPIMGEDVLAELGIDLVEHSTLLSDSSAFIFDFGSAAGRTDAEADYPNRMVMEAGILRVERDEYRRSDEGNPPRRIIAINAINNDYETLIRSVVAAAHTPFSVRMRHGFILPPLRGREDWLPWIQVGEAGVRIGPVIKSLEGQTGTIAFGGAYRHLRSGFYLLTIKLAVQEAASPSAANEPCVTMEVIYSSAVLGALAIKRGDLKAGEYRIPVYLPEDLAEEIGGLETRIRAVTPVKIAIDGLTIEPSIQDTKSESKLSYALQIGDWLPFLHVGKIGHVDESGVYSKKGDTGHIVYGPYWKLPPGTYEATLTIEKNDEEADSNVLGVVDITVGGCKVGARKILARRRNERGPTTSTISVPFTISSALAVKPTKTEIQVWSSGVAALRVKAALVKPRSEDPSILDSKKDWMPLMRIGEAGVRVGDLIKTIKRKCGCLAYGPYEYLRGGSYDLIIEFDEAATETRSTKETALVIEVRTPAHTFATRAISYNELKKQECRLSFDVPSGISDGFGDIEARIHAVVPAVIRIRALTVEQTSRMRHGFVLPPLKGREDWLPWIQAGETGVRIGPVIKSVEGQTGTIAFGGPYRYLRPGFYLLKIKLAVQEAASPSAANEPCVTMEVIYSSAVLGTLAIKRGDLKTGEYRIPIYLPEDLAEEISGLETRIHAVTPVKIAIDGLTIEPSVQDTKSESELSYALQIENWLPFLHVGKVGHVDESGVYSKKGDTGHIVYGPYWKLPPGTYEATLTIEKSDEDADSNVLGVVDIIVGGCKVGAQKILAYRRNERKPTSTISVPFTILSALAVKPTKTEIQVWSTGVAALRIKAVLVKPRSEDPSILDSKKDWMPLMRIGEAGVRDGDLIKTIKGKRGCIAYGPYEYLRGGSYDLIIEFDAVATETRSTNETALVIEVWTPTHTFATRAISYNELKKQECRLSFDVPSGISDGFGDIEARVYALVPAVIGIRALTVAQTSRNVKQGPADTIHFPRSRTRHAAGH